MKKDVLLFLIGLLLAACPARTPSQMAVAQVNGEKILLEDFQKALAEEEWKFGGEIDFSKQKVLDDLIQKRLLLQEALRRGMVVTPGEADQEMKRWGKTMENFREERLVEIKLKKLMNAIMEEKIALSQEDLKIYYESHLEAFRHPEQVHARQIVTDSMEKALALREMILGGSPFEEVAQKYSMSPDRKKGGDLGWFGRETMPPEFDQICFHLPVGSISPVVKTPYGFHMFQVLERRPAGQFPLSEVEGEIRAKLREVRGKAIFERWFEDLKKKATIKVDQKLLEKNS